MDEAHLRADIKLTVLFMKGSGLCQISNKPEIISFMGTFILVEPQFCYAVVDRSMVRPGFSYEATLPDESVVSVSYDEFVVAGNRDLAALYIYQNVVNYNENVINAVQFAEQEASMFEQVRLADFDERQTIFFPGVRVNDLENHFFMLDWNSKNTGAPVYNEDGALVGICYLSPLEPSYAYTLSALMAHLFKLSVVSMQTFEEFLDQVRQSAF